MTVTSLLLGLMPLRFYCITLFKNPNPKLVTIGNIRSGIITFYPEAIVNLESLIPLTAAIMFLCSGFVKSLSFQLLE
jgi:hypothetical protein